MITTPRFSRFTAARTRQAAATAPSIRVPTHGLAARMTATCTSCCRSGSRRESACWRIRGSGITWSASATCGGTAMAAKTCPMAPGCCTWSRSSSSRRCSRPASSRSTTSTRCGKCVRSTKGSSTTSSRTRARGSRSSSSAAWAGAVAAWTATKTASRRTRSGASPKGSC